MSKHSKNHGPRRSPKKKKDLQRKALEAIEVFDPDDGGFDDLEISADPDAILMPTGINAPTGQWIQVRKGQIAAPDTYYDEDGVLRSIVDHSVVVWHWRSRAGRCLRKGLTPEERVQDPASGAWWCPDCYPKQLQAKKDEEFRKAMGAK